MIDYTFTVSEEEYLEAQSIFVKAQQRESFWLRRGRTISGVVLLLCVLLIMSATRNFWKIGVFLSIFSVPSLITPWLQKRNFRKRFKVERKSMMDLHVKMDDDGYHVEAAHLGTGTASWSAAEQWFEGKAIFVIRTGYLMRVLPKRPLSESELEEVRDILMRHIGPEGTKRAA